MNLQRALNSQQAGLSALRISRILPPSAGIWLANFVADRIASRRDLPIVRAIRLNRWVVSGCKLKDAELDLEVKKTIRQIACSYYFLFHHINHPDELQKLVAFSPEIDDLIEASRRKDRGLLVAGLHMSNFDLVMQAAAWRGLEAVAVSLPEENENRQAVEWQHHFRRQAGLEILPASLATFRKAIRRLEAGEIVLTGADRPIQTPKNQPLFFGHPASVPIHHIHLALEARVPLILICAIRRSDGKYHMLASPEIQMNRSEDRQKAILSNAEEVLKIAEGFILEAPEQWSIFQPVWPGLLELMP